MIGLFLLAMAADVPIEVGKFDPSAFPQAVKVDRRMPQSELTARVDRIMASGQCAFRGQAQDSYSITVPYAVMIEPAGNVTKVVVKEVGCPAIELLTGQVAKELAKARDFRPTNSPVDQWYVSEVYYIHGGQDVARQEKDDDKIVCEAPKHATGSNLVMQRDCRTVAQWRVYRLDRERLRRDLLGDGTNVKNE